MLEIDIKDFEGFKPDIQELINVKGQKIQIEHSLISLHKWETKWHKPFLGKQDKSYEELIDYIRCMTLTKNVNFYLYYGLSHDNIKSIKMYMEDPMTATTFSSNPITGAQKDSNEIITAEIIYYWMISLNIPWECRKWHLRQLLALIKTVNIKNNPDQKMSRTDIIKQNAALNAERCKRLNTRG